MKVKRGDIYWIEKSKHHKATGSEMYAGRPAIIVSNDQNNENSPTVEIVYLTTAPKKDLPTHCTITSTAENSTALCEQISTISKERLGRQVGSCTPQEMKMVDICMVISLGIDYIEVEEEYSPTEDQQYIAWLEETIMNLKFELARAQKGEEVYKELLNNQIEKHSQKQALV